jgi:hypothetical protein
MKKIAALLCSLAMVLCVAGNAGAIPVTFTDITTFTESGTDQEGDLDGSGGDYVNKLEGLLDYVSWTHHFVFDPPILEPAEANILSATLMISLLDDDQDSGCFTGEYAFGFAEDGAWDFGEVDTGDYSYNVALSALTDGAFSVRLVDLWGDFFITQSSLTVTYNAADAAPVPEPATVLLVGCGLIGLIGFGRKRFKNTKS